MSAKTRTTPEDPGSQESQGSPEEIYLGRGAAADVWWVSGSKVDTFMHWATTMLKELRREFEKFCE
ncbi:hypothetical protein FS749_013476 [Ceratobasidium sp. UAMH 11750]|nr:hypothetical protein FS749_013476 [Ceratobasidium sp. UAMH 11750]